MSGSEVITFISFAIESVKTCREIYNTIKDIQDLPAAFHEVSNQLPLVQTTLEAAKQAAQAATTAGNGDPNNLANEGESMLTTIKSCNKKVEDLKKIFRKARDLREDNKPFRKGYRAIVETLGGTKHRVEALMRGIIDNILSLSANQVFRLATQDQVDNLKQAVEALDAVEPSVEDMSQMAGKNFEHSGSGNMNNQFGDGDMFNVANGGTVNSADNMHFGHPPPHTR